MNKMSKKFWTEISDRETAHERILTGHRKTPVLPFGSTLPKLIKDKKINKVLDFGCGVGRNTYGLVNLYNEVHGYDFPNMTEMLLQDSRYETFKKKITIYNEWEQVKQNKYDAVYAYIVFQHIEDTVLENYLKDLQTMTDYLVIHTRSYIDGSKSLVIPMLEKYFNIEGEIIPDRTDNSSASKEVHYKLVMTPKR